MAKRFIMRIELTGPAKKKLEQVSEQHGMTQVAAMSRLVEFFSSRDERVQAAIIGRFSGEVRRMSRS